jgi:CheY-like chemotaxis protein
VVDDFVPWRNYLIGTLGQNPALQIVGFASDGAEAVLRACELRPDLILMDVSLPELSGIQAAARIRGLSPESKILFVSQNIDFDIALAALDAGGLGYVVKSDAESELLTAVEAVLSGKGFVSASLASQDFAGVLVPHAPRRSRTEASMGLSGKPLLRNQAICHSHEVEFYGNDASFLMRCTRFIGAALANGDAVVVILTPSHRDRLRQKLLAEGCDVAEVVDSGRYVALEPSDVLSTFLVNDEINADRYRTAVGELMATALKAAAGKQPRVVVCGECPALLLAEGNPEAAVELERLWNELAERYNVDSLCGYPIERFRSQEQGLTFQRICAEHSAVYSQ